MEQSVSFKKEKYCFSLSDQGEIIAIVKNNIKNLIATGTYSFKKPVKGKQINSRGLCCKIITEMPIDSSAIDRIKGIKYNKCWDDSVIWDIRCDPVNDWDREYNTSYEKVLLVLIADAVNQWKELKQYLTF